VFRIRHAVSYAVHKYFNDKGFNYLHTPIITGSDAEGAGEMFKVTLFEPNKAPTNEDGTVDYTQDFFGKPVNLTVSGQLEAELGSKEVHTKEYSEFKEERKTRALDSYEKTFRAPPRQIP
jgi:asparaginyl-tRNA synthetase